MVKEESSEERFGDNVGKPMDPNHVSMLKSVGEPVGQVLHGSSGALSPQQLPGSGVGIKIEINPVLTPSVPQGSLIGIPDSNQGWNPPQPQRQPLNQVARTNQQSQSSVNNIHQQNQNGRKRKQPVSGTANTAGPSPRSAPSSHTPGNVFSMANLPHSGGSSHDDGYQQDAVGLCMDVSKGFTFSEVYSVHASTGKVICCDFSSDGKLLASAGHDKKVVLWYTDTMKPKTTLEEHTAMITDVRFSPSLPRLATSSFDKTVRVWDVDNEGSSLRTFVGHSSMVTSLDFHPNKDDLICSCDNDGEIRYWSINNGSCTRVYKGGSTQVRFQPRVGKYLAASSANVVSVLDVETQACLHSLQGHSTPINSVCWDPSGDFLTTVSKDMVKVWTLGTGSEGECVYELSFNGSNFMSCVFHPSYPSLLVIGCYQSIELWNLSENKTMTLPAHEALIASMAVSTATGLVASASHDKLVKLWK